MRTAVLLFTVRACAIGSNALAAYYGWTDTLFGSVCDAFRVWARPAPGTQLGIAENGPTPALLRFSPTATIIRGVLDLAVASRQNTGYRAGLLDAAGRKMMELTSGANNVRGLAPGVYFASSSPGLAHTFKVVITN